MLRFVSVLFAVVVFVANADAQETTQSAKAMLEATAIEAKVHGDKRFAFTLDFWSENKGEELSLKLRFDPRLPEGEQWRPAEGGAKELSKDQRKALKRFQKAENPDDALVYDKLDEELDRMTLIEENDETAIFSAPIIDDDLPPDALEMTITLDKKARSISRIDVRSLKPFKPAAIAKLTSMTQSQTYAPSDGEGPVLLQTSESTAIGKAMLKSFNSKTRQVYSDIEEVDPAEMALTSEDRE